MIKKVITCLIVSLLITTNISCSNRGLEDRSGEESAQSSVDNLTPVVYGSQYSDAGTLWVLKPDNTYYFFKSKDHLDDNYYKGPMVLRSAISAMEEVGYDQEEFDRTLGAYCGVKENIYSIGLMSSMLHSSGIDKPYENERLLFHQVFMISKDSNDEAIAVDITQGKQYELHRLKDYVNDQLMTKVSPKLYNDFCKHLVKNREQVSIQ